jgi:hypothetical protein
VRSTPVTTGAAPPADFIFNSRYVLVLIIGAFCFFGPSLRAQVSGSQTSEGMPKQWQSTTDLRSDGLLPERIPVRISESHSENGDRTLDKRSIEIRGTDGHFEPYQDIEKETFTADASTVRTTTRTFARDVNGRKTLVQLTEEEKHILPGAGSRAERTTYNPDIDGRLQPVQREIVETKHTDNNGEETNKTVMLATINGGLAPAYKTHEVRKTAANGAVETEKTTWLPDINGKWQLSEIRKNVSTQETEGRKTEEEVFRPDAEGNLAHISRVVTQVSGSPAGDQRSVVAKYSIDVPGATREGGLHLIERTTSTVNSYSLGERATEERVEQTDPGDPGSGLRVSIVTDGKIVPAQSGELSTVTIRARDSNGSFGVVSVDITKGDRIPTIQIQPMLGDKPR